MDEITFEDILNHYEVKLRESSEEIQNIKNTLKRCISLSESSWKGLAADSFRLKLENINSELNKSYGELSLALTKLSDIGNLLAEGEENQVL